MCCLANPVEMPALRGVYGAASTCIDSLWETQMIFRLITLMVTPWTTADKICELLRLRKTFRIKCAATIATCIATFGLSTEDGL